MPVLVSRLGVPANRVSDQQIQRAAKRILALLQLPKAELSILLCDNSTIKKLNHKYRKKNKATDVLSFGNANVTPKNNAHTILGDVVISVPYAAAQAKRMKRKLIDEVQWLLAHGVLHLLGLDHPSRAQTLRMNTLSVMLVNAAQGRSDRVAFKKVCRELKVPWLAHP